LTALLVCRLVLRLRLRAHCQNERNINSGTESSRSGVLTSVGISAFFGDKIGEHNIEDEDDWGQNPALESIPMNHISHVA
jgi:hypothetical protein